ncbi:MAG: type II toxin-antitoxin system RelE/ParE family toxin [Acholeplasmataceae bacterium]
MNKIIYTERVRRDIIDIINFLNIRYQDNKLGKKFLDEFNNKCESLKQFPYMGTISNDNFLKSNTYRYLVFRKYLIYYFYKEEEKTIYIVSVFSARKDLEKQFKKY